MMGVLTILLFIALVIVVIMGIQLWLKLVW